MGTSLTYKEGRLCEGRFSVGASSACDLCREHEALRRRNPRKLDQRQSVYMPADGSRQKAVQVERRTMDSELSRVAKLP